MRVLARECLRQRTWSEPEGEFNPSDNLQPRTRTLHSVHWSGFGPLLLAATVSMTMAEFIEVQKLSPPDLRTRFGLASSCEPSITALWSVAAMNRVTVAIECRQMPGETPPRPEPGTLRPATPTKKAP